MKFCLPQIEVEKSNYKCNKNGFNILESFILFGFNYEVWRIQLQNMCQKKKREDKIGLIKIK